MASLTPAAAAMSFVLVPLNPFLAKLSIATRSSCRRRSSPGMRGVGVREMGLGMWGAGSISKYSLLSAEMAKTRVRGLRLQIGIVICFDAMQGTGALDSGAK